MEKIIGVLQRWRKNILNYNMDKSEKCYYAVIGNNKRGKFYGASPIQVAKKVASKKLKAGKEMEFYLDEVADKKKRIGPYQARKDKKSGKVAVVKARKVMKGGVLSESDRVKLKKFFDNINNNGIGQRVQLTNNHLKKIYTKSILPIISFYREPIVFFNVIRHFGNNSIYTLAAFKESIGNIYIMIYIIINNNTTKIDIVSMTEFFLNPYYFYYLNELYYKNNNNQSQKNILDFKYILESLQKSDNNDSRTIREEAGKIYELLYIPTNNKSTKKAIIYVPNYYQPRIKKCVYPDLTFGVLDKETVNQRINQGMIESEVPKSFYQLYLIKQQSFFTGYYEPVIYIQLPLLNKEELEKQKLLPQSQSKNNPYFNYCIYTDPTDRNRLKIIIYDPKSQYGQLSTSDFNEKLSNDNNIKMACSILLTIPEEFGKLQRVRRIANNIINPPQFIGLQGNSLRQPLLSPVSNIK